MAALGKRLIPVELLRRSCRRKQIDENTCDTALEKNNPNVQTKQEHSKCTIAPATIKVESKDAQTIETRAERSIKIEIKLEQESHIENKNACEPDGYLQVDSDELNLERTLMGGQSFRWRMQKVIVLPVDMDNNLEEYQNATSLFTGVVGDYVLQLWRCDSQRIAYRRLNKKKFNEENAEQFLCDYFQLEYNLKDLYTEWSQKDDHFKRASLDYRGFRILRQDPVENVFSFICATNNNIKRISLMVDKMCREFGKQLETDDDNKETDKHASDLYFSFPTIERLAQEDVFDLLRYKLGFGYRAKFICATAKKLISIISSNDDNANKLTTPRDYLLHLRELPYKDTCKRLQEFPGIGRKVADCICLMSMDHLESVPIDCHIYEIVCRNYLKALRQERKTLTESVHDLIGSYFVELHGPLAGWATSVLFIGELKHLKVKQSSKVGPGAPESKFTKNKRQKTSGC